MDYKKLLTQVEKTLEQIRLHAAHQFQDPALLRVLYVVLSIVSAALIEGTRSWRVPSGFCMSIARPRLM